MQLRGRVLAFEEHRGLGEVELDPTPGIGLVVGYPFHCTAIVDGTRTIAVGTPVRFRVVNGPTGAYEASELVSCT